MRLTPNDNICEPAKPDATDWKSIKWYKVNRHVDSLQKRIYRASKNNDTLILLDKCILEPIVSKGTRLVLRREGRSNPPDLSDKGCFDNLSHDFILKQLKGFTLNGVVERILKAGYLDNNVFNETIKGTPQGGLLSPLLANIALTGLEEYLNITYKAVKHDKNGDEYVTYATKGNYRVVRYADDFVIFAKTKEEINEVRNILEPYLDERGLELAEDKTHITHTHEGFNFLGFNCRLYKSQNRYKCLIKPSKESIKKAKEKISDIFYYCRGNSVDFLIDKLNPVIEGIGYFWRISVAKQTYSDMDNYIWKKLYRFLRRLHLHKSWKWIVKKYFPQYDEEGNFIGKWTLVGPNDKNQLTKMASIPIRRWNMIKYNYSPYDISKTEYFENHMKKQFSRR